MVLRIHISDFRVYSSVFRVRGLGCWVWVLEFLAIGGTMPGESVPEAGVRHPQGVVPMCETLRRGRHQMSDTLCVHRNHAEVEASPIESP